MDIQKVIREFSGIGVICMCVYRICLYECNLN